MTQPFDRLKGPTSSTTVFFSTLHNKLFFIETCRLIFYVLMTLSFLIFQITNRHFIIPEINTIVYVMLFFAFLLNALYLLFFHSSKYLLSVAMCLFIFDSLFISSLIYVTGVNQPIFLFLYLINILLCGLIFPWRGAFFLALLTSLLFSVLLILNPSIVASSFAFAVGVNNLSFFLVAFLSSYLSSQMGFMGQKIEHQTQNIHTLQDLNTLILETMPSGLLVFDQNGFIVQSNLSAEKILQTDLLQLDVRTLFQKISTHLTSSIYQTTSQASWEEEYTASSGQKILSLTLTPLKIGSHGDHFIKNEDNESKSSPNNILGHILLIRDLTDIKQLEDMARRNEKMAAIGQLAAGIAHEIRNPLASISGSVQLLQVGTSQAQGHQNSKDHLENEKLYAIVLKEIDRLNLLITDFLNYAKPEQISYNRVDINAVLRETLKRIKFNQQLPQHIQSFIDLQAKEDVLGQVERLEQVFLNLLINAYQAMEQQHPAKLFVRSYDKDGSVYVSIKDTGPGLKPTVKDRIFEPFLTTKASGTGLGLATTHKILDAHGAKIFTISTEGKGAEFLIEFTSLYKAENKDNVIPLEVRKKDSFVSLSSRRG